MERLILEYQSGDGYTFSSTNTLPIIYKSKESAIEDLTNLIIEHLENQEQYEKTLVTLEKNTRTCMDKVQHLRKNGSEKETQKANENLTKAIHASTDLRNNFLQKDEFIFAGTKLYFSSFYYSTDSGKREIDMPNVFTLDEFFKHVELNTNLDKEETNKTKHKP